MIGRTLGHYRIAEKIGEGGMGVVYRAHDEHLNRDVALKVLPPGTLADEAARKRFRKEALALSKLNHPNIETVHDFDTQDGVDFLVMEHIPGVTLSDKLAARPLPEKEIGRLGLQLAEGLAAAHEQGVIHRDLKPGNLRVTPDGRLKILDFGLAKLIRPTSATATTESMSETEGRAGTPLYMAPEQRRGEKVDARSDIYAAGLVLLQMAMGELPVVRGRVLGGRVSPDLERIIGKCLEEDPELRYQSAKELAVDLRRLGATTPARVLSRRAVLVATAVLAALAVLVSLNVGGLRERLFGAGSPKIDSIAVLPLKNLMGDPEQDYFVEGMHEALITELSKISTLKVISRTSAMRYKETDKPLPQVARELNVDAVIEGSVLREGEQVRITVQLIHGPTDKHLWADSYQRELRGILALQSDVARAIAGEVRVAVTPAEATRLASTRPVNPAAHEAYLKARFYRYSPGPEARGKDIDHFQLALQIDPNYAPAYAGLAESYATLGTAETLGLPPRDAMSKAEEAALKALQIDATLAEAHTALGQVKLFYAWDWESAEKELKRALELNPNSLEAWHWYSHLLTALGRQQEAFRASRRALELDPVNLQVQVHLTWYYLVARQYEQVFEQGRKVLELYPEARLPYDYLARAYSHKGLHDLALTHAQEAIKVSGRNPYQLATLGFVYAAAGKRTEALQVLEELKAVSGQRHVTPYSFATIYAALGDPPQALAWLEKAHRERAAFMVYLRADARLDPLRPDPRFQDLLRRMNFPE